MHFCEILNSNVNDYFAVQTTLIDEQQIFEKNTLSPPPLQFFSSIDHENISPIQNKTCLIQDGGPI